MLNGLPKVGKIAATMDNTDDIDLLFADEPVNDPVTPEEYLANIVAFGFGGTQLPVIFVFDQYTAA